jgi:hypothetical protein
MKPKYEYLLSLLTILFSFTAGAQVAINKVDTTMKIGKAGYRVTCRNRSIAENPLAIRPVGMESDARPIDVMVKGRVSFTAVDDLNTDGFPDLILFLYSDSNATKGSVYCVISEGNKTLAPCFLPDISYDPKVNKGYKGHDKFALLEGSLLHQFPIYNAGDADDKPTGGERTLMYQVIKGENGGYKFNRIRFYDTK